MILTKEKGKRMWGNGFGAGSSGSDGSGGSGGGGEGGSMNYATEAGHAREADHAASAAKLDSNSPDWNVIARKNVEETIAETWTFAKGLIASLKSYFNAGIQVIGGIIADTIGRSDSRVDKIWAKDLDVTNINAKNTTTENLVVTKEAHFFKLVIDELLSNKGAIIISSANCTAELVVPDNQQSPTYFDVYFSTVDRDGNSVSNPWREGDQAICMTFDIGGAGTFEHVSNRYYWRLVTAVESNVEYPAGSGATYHRVRLSNVSGEYEGSTTPDVGDDIVQLGYRGNDADYRKSAIILSAYPTMDAAVTPPSLCFYRGISTFALSDYRKTYMDAANNDFYGNFRVYADGSWKNITTIFASEVGLQEEVSHREAADQALSNGYSQLKMSWNKISQSVFSLVNIANKSSFTQTDTTTEWASDINGDAIVANNTFASYKPKEMVVSFDYDYTTYPSQGVQSIIVFGYINGSSTRSFEVNISIASDGSVTATKTIGDNNVDYDVTVDGTTGHVNVTFRNGGNDITSANVHISPQWGVITIKNIIVADTDESHSFKRTGIDVTDGTITCIGDNFVWKDQNNNNLLWLDSGGNANFTGIITATGGNITGNLDVTGNGKLTVGTQYRIEISPDGSTWGAKIVGKEVVGQSATQHFSLGFAFANDAFTPELFLGTPNTGSNIKVTNESIEQTIAISSTEGYNIEHGHFGSGTSKAGIKFSNSGNYNVKFGIQNNGLIFISADSWPVVNSASDLGNIPIGSVYAMGDQAVGSYHIRTLAIRIS